jgi:hypothetical protein
VSQQPPETDPGANPTGAPVTGLPAVDDALRALDDLDGRPVSEHHDALSAAHEALHESLQSSAGPAGS